MEHETAVFNGADSSSDTVEPASNIDIAPAGRPWNRRLLCAAILCCGVCLTGCSLVVMANRMVFGDTKVTCAFKGQTAVDLAADDKTVLVICSSQDSIREDYPEIEFDLLEGMTRRLKRQKIKMISPSEVSTWIDDRGGSWDDVSELANAFETDYIIHIDIDSFTYMEENSPELFRGNTLAKVKAYEVPKKDVGDINNKSFDKRPLQVFYHEFRSTYPEHTPISAQRMSPKVFRKKYMDQTCIALSKLFYDYLIGDRL